MDAPRRTLVVANRTAATPRLLDEVERRARERPTAFTLLVPDAPTAKHADWTLAEAVPLMERAAGGTVEGIAGTGDPFESVRDALEQHAFDDVLISTLPTRTSAWLRRDLPNRVKRLGVPVSVISEERQAFVSPVGPGPAGGPG